MILLRCLAAALACTSIYACDSGGGVEEPPPVIVALEPTTNVEALTDREVDALVAEYTALMQFPSPDACGTMVGLEALEREARAPTLRKYGLIEPMDPMDPESRSPGPTETDWRTRLVAIQHVLLLRDAMPAEFLRPWMSKPDKSSKIPIGYCLTPVKTDGHGVMSWKPECQPTSR